MADRGCGDRGLACGTQLGGNLGVCLADEPTRSQARRLTVALRWTRSAFADLQRTYEFLEPVDPAAAVRAVRAIVARARRIPRQPRLGERVPAFGDREVRRVLVQTYELRYEVAGTALYVLGILHTREDR